MDFASLPDGHAHAMITNAVGAYSKGESLRSVWAESFRILRPGAHALVLVSGPHPSTISIDFRRVGFEFRDTILVAATRDGHMWCGPCLVFRKPIEESTVARQVLATGTGGMNINACRVKHANKADFEAHKAMVDALKAKGGSLGNSWKNTSDLSNANEVSLAGRWPGNVLLVHAPGCKRTGEAKVDAPIINRFDDGMKPFGNGAGHAYTSTRTGDADGKETVAVYECVPECPVGVLNSQSGITTSGAMKREVPGYEGESATPFLRGRSGPSNQHGDTGGASRFFSQFEAAPELREWLIRLGLPPGGVLFDPFRES